MDPIAAPRIVLAHGPGRRLFTDADLARIAEAGELLDPEPLENWDDQRAARLLARAQVLIGHWGCPRLDARMLERAPELGLFAYTAGSVRGVVDDVVFERGVRVTSCADRNAQPVAEYTLATILLAGKDAFRRRDALREPGVVPSGPRPGFEPGNRAKTVGIVGASQVGRRVVALLAIFPDLELVLADPFVDDAEAAELGVTRLGLDELCAVSDVVSVHVPDLPSTRHLIGAAELAAMRDGACLVNTARGAVVDQDALTAEVVAGRLYAVLDVTDPEPLPDDHPLRTSPNVFLTPHVAGSEGTELGRLVDGAVDEVQRWSAGRPARNEVTRDQLGRLA